MPRWQRCLGTWSCVRRVPGQLPCLMKNVTVHNGSRKGSRVWLRRSARVKTFRTRDASQSIASLLCLAEAKCQASCWSGLPAVNQLMPSCMGNGKMRSQSRLSMFPFPLAISLFHRPFPLVFPPTHLIIYIIPYPILHPLFISLISLIFTS